MAEVHEFDEATKEQFIKDDRAAWYAICTILLAIIAVGLLLAFLAVYLVSSGV